MNQVLCRYSVIFIFVFLPSFSSIAALNIVFLNPGHPDENATGSFWSKVTTFMDAAAQDLNIKLTTVHANRDHILMKSLATTIIKLDPDYVVLVNEKGIAVDIIKTLAPHNIPIFMLLNTLNNKDLSKLTEQQKSLIKGSVTPNNLIAGEQLLEGLFNIFHQQVTTTTPPKLLALQGDYTTPASLQREQGFHQALQKNKAQLIDSSVSNWSKEMAYYKTKGILWHAQINIIWAANDAMAFGAKKAVTDTKINYPVIIGGINWDFDEPEYPVDLSLGGHVTLGAMALVMINDIANNQLNQEKTVQQINIFESSLSPHYKGFKQLMTQGKINQIDFSRFSQTHKNPLTFSIENLIKAMH